MRCPKCGDDTHLYRNAEMIWVPDQKKWQLSYVYFTVDCTECDHAFDYEEDEHEGF